MRRFEDGLAKVRPLISKTWPASFVILCNVFAIPFPGKPKTPSRMLLLWRSLALLPDSLLQVIITLPALLPLRLDFRLLFDTTPARFVTMIVTEYEEGTGNAPPSAIQTILRKQEDPN